jgi:hypothetical protein
MEFREDLPYLLNRKRLLGVGVEVGVLRGDFSAHILKFWEGRKLYLVDAWRHLPGVVDINNPDHNGHLDNMAKAFMKIYEYDHRATIIRDTSVAASCLFPDKSLDFVYIDAGHSYEDAMRDLIAWYPKVSPAGVFCGHDYLDSKYADNGIAEFGVKRAVDEFAGKHSRTVCSTPENNYPTWWFKV